MYLDEVFADFEFATAEEYEDEDEDFYSRRQLQENKLTGNGAVDLQSVIRSEIRRGDPDTSAPMSNLGFEVSLVSYERDMLFLKYVFENPLSISIGEKPDILVIEFVEPQLFTSRETGKTMAPDSVITRVIPK